MAGAEFFGKLVWYALNLVRAKERVRPEPNLSGLVLEFLACKNRSAVWGFLARDWSP
jgi:hypothetical protein